MLLGEERQEKIDDWPTVLQQLRAEVFASKKKNEKLPETPAPHSLVYLLPLYSLSHFFIPSSYVTSV
jgi:hypothetical protein